jgi:transcriptional regulator with XRE-family HTH domain
MSTARRSSEPNTKLREQRIIRGWSQNDVADRMYEIATTRGLPEPRGLDASYVSRWERGMMPEPYYGYLLCLAFDVRPGDLGLPGEYRPGEAADPAPVTDLHSSSRRIDSERIADSLVHTGRVDVVLLDDLGAIVRTYANQAQAIAPAVLLPAVLDHLRRVRSLLGGSHPEATRRRLQVIACETFVVAGRLAFWADNRGDAAAYFAAAQQLALEAGEGKFRAMALAFRADLFSVVPYLGTIPGNTSIALAMFDHAASLDAADWSPLLRAWVLACRAEEHAILGRADESDRDMDAAHRAMASARPSDATILDIAALDITASSAGLTGFAGACALALGRANEAATAFDAGLAEASSAGRLSGLAAAHALQHEAERAAELLTDALDLAVKRGLPTRLRRVEGVRHRYLSAYEHTPAVQRFDERFRSYALTSR